ncbi:hypothetical protein TOPH_05593 [Tolypocladium ophioglossoides CBS 100239]|uniref:Uncharacterized protein n=1 Tax=Tolypocladium ophioglossoides (strain CBS 100239) TaxID=1163406 RepID=A0A0L0N6E8_TOLOC|nr:hypothetical protein TOPH_05593 [Tolypocladium ophioglossoides CBS 100239]
MTGTRYLDSPDAGPAGGRTKRPRGAADSRHGIPYCNCPLQRRPFAWMGFGQMRCDGCAAMPWRGRRIRLAAPEQGVASGCPVWLPTARKKERSLRHRLDQLLPGDSRSRLRGSAAPSRMALRNRNRCAGRCRKRSATYTEAVSTCCPRWMVRRLLFCGCSGLGTHGIPDIACRCSCICETCSEDAHGWLRPLAWMNWIEPCGPTSGRIQRLETPHQAPPSTTISAPCPTSGRMQRPRPLARGASKHHAPSVDDDIRPVDIRARPAQQHHHYARHLLGHAHPSKRIPPAPRPPRLGQPLALVEHRVHVPRADAVDGDAVARPLGGQRALEHHHGRLADVVRGLRLREVDAVRGYRRRQHDAPARALRDHLPRGRLRAQERARGVDVEHPAPLGGGHVERVNAAHDAGEADERVY